ncbi:MAG: SUMF1/EgtB/PvdO family nonheme iron enzyme [Acidobacteria bacterium]|nr:SUMF1/EgtB/PvdO family nonheme iron enzyme [Acidobacteriota bacterium]
MNEQLDVTTLICNVLSHSALERGVNTVIPIQLPSSAQKVGIRGFQLRASGLTGERTEDLLLLGSDQIDSAVAEIPALVADSKADRVLMACDLARLGVPPASWERLEVFDFAQLFQRLCAIPDRLPKLIFAKARRDFNRAIYKERYQSRLLHLINSPDRGNELCREEISADEYFRDWARADTTRHPILLLGERGSGKTWQMLRFCQDIFELHQNAPWLYGPPLYFDLREEGTHLGAFGSSVPLFPESVLREYQDVRFLWDTKLIEALIATGHLPLCIDGFEEVSHIIEGNDGDAVDFLQRICSVLSLRSRFIIACRATHFGSLKKFLHAEVWPNVSVASAFEVVSLVPFGQASVRAYLSTVAEQRKNSLEKVLQHSQAADAPIYQAALIEALNICQTYPALLASMVDKATQSFINSSATDLLNAALVGAVIDYNIQMGKTSDIYCRDDGEVVTVGTDERLEVLGELVWHLAARGQELVDMSNIPARIARYYGLDIEAIKTDIRTHTLLELPPNGIRETTNNEPAHKPEVNPDLGEAVMLRFATRPGTLTPSEFFPQHNGQDSKAQQELNEKTERAQTLTTTALSAAPMGVTSVSGAFLLAKHIADKLVRAVHLPLPSQNGKSAPIVDRLGAIGEVPLGLAAAGILRELLANVDLGVAGYGPLALVALAKAKIAECAARRDFSVFSPYFRYLGHNLEAMGLLSYAERTAIDPWYTSNIHQIVRRPARLPGYKMVLVSPPPEEAVPKDLQQVGLVSKAPGLGRPFLMGVGEVTNSDYLTFVKSVEGRDWRVEAMTIAGGSRNGSRSRFADLANEYYLYFWEELALGDSPSHLPLKSQLHHPVGYVSWFACAAFCDWLTQAEYPGEAVYNDYFRNDASTQTQSSSDDITFRAGYRLPSVQEWSWTARGGRLDVTYPWELYPLCLPEQDVETLSKSKVVSTADAASLAWLDSWRSVHKNVFLNTPKDHIPILSDPFNQLGTSGMMGNVKEWCNDPFGDKRPILGATSFLGERSFNFDYGIMLFPQNTNPDVGFRICRPLSDAEIDVLVNREAEVAQLEFGAGPFALTN